MLSNTYRIHNGHTISMIVLFPTGVEVDCFAWQDEMRQCALGNEIKVGTYISKTHNQLRTYIVFWGMAGYQIRWYRFTTGTGIIYVKVFYDEYWCVYVEHADAQDISCMDLIKDGWDATNIEDVIESLYDDVVKAE